jgi:hypothetical protein
MLLTARNVLGLRIVHGATLHVFLGRLQLQISENPLTIGITYRDFALGHLGRMIRTLGSTLATIPYFISHPEWSLRDTHTSSDMFICDGQ